MLSEQFSRSALLVGDQPIQKLHHAHIAIFGVGGVGGAVVEALARGGIGHFSLFDNDVVGLSNLNRQLIATHDTIGLPKVDVARDRILAINPDATVDRYPVFYLPENADQYDLSSYDYIVDCIDTVSAKLTLIQRAKAQNVPIISAMGTGNKLDPTQFIVTDLAKTEGCPLARILRKELRRRGIQHLDVVYSTEAPRKPRETICENGRRGLPGSMSFVPPVAGMILAGEVLKKLMEIE